MKSLLGLGFVMPEGVQKEVGKSNVVEYSFELLYLSHENPPIGAAMSFNTVLSIPYTRSSTWCRSSKRTSSNSKERTNPFEDPQGRFFVLVNEEQQRSLWPAFAEVPAGWTKVFGEESREVCLACVAENWTDMRPLSIR